jgi:hypothetical protein
VVRLIDRQPVATCRAVGGRLGLDAATGELASRYAPERYQEVIAERAAGHRI